MIQILDTRGEPSYSTIRQGPNHEPSGASSSPHDNVRTGRLFDPHASIVLIGVRGAGKRSLAFIAAAQLGWRFITEGLYFEAACGMCKAKYLQEYGHTALYQKTLSIFKRMLCENSHGCVIECGMGSLTREAQDILHDFAKTHPVVHVIRDFDHIAKLLKINGHDVARLKQADMNHRKCSNMEFYNAYDPTCTAETETAPENFNPSSSFILQNVKTDCQRFISFLSGRKPYEDTEPFSLSAVMLEDKSNTYVTTVRFSDLHSGKVIPDEIESGEDAINVLIDASVPELMMHISKYIALIKRALRLPIIYSVEDGALEPDRNPVDCYNELLEHGLRQAVDYLVVDINTPQNIVASTLQGKGRTKIIGDYAVKASERLTWLEPSRFAAYERGMSLGMDLMKITQVAANRKDNEDVRIFRDRVKVSWPDGPRLIAYNLGQLGRSSLITNTIMTPVACRGHKLDGTVSFQRRDAEICMQQAFQARFRCFELDPLRFLLVGQHVSYSRTPFMHNAAYHLYGLEHVFSIHETANFDEILPLWHHPNFGGSAVSFPYKEQAFMACKSTSTHAAAIGSINTVIPLRMGPAGQVLLPKEQAAERNRGGTVLGLYGDNSDWCGVYQNIKLKLSPRNSISPEHSTGLVLGAGGTARSSIYALLQLGCQNVVVWNRTYEHGVKTAEHFNQWASKARSLRHNPVQVLKPNDMSWPSGVSLPTMIIACIPTTEYESGFQLPEQWLESQSGGVAADVSHDRSFLLEADGLILP